MKKFLSLLFITGCCALLLSGCLPKEKEEEAALNSEEIVQTPASEEESETPVIEIEENVDSEEAVLPTAAVRTANNLAEMNTIISENQNVVIDFYATWCGPCMYMSPIIDQLAAEKPDIVFVKVDTDTFKDAFKGFELGGKQIRISGIPSIHLFKDGSSVDEIRGSTDKASFTKILETNFAKKS